MDHPIARRTIIAGAGAGLATSLISKAHAQVRCLPAQKIRLDAAHDPASHLLAGFR